MSGTTEEVTMTGQRAGDTPAARRAARISAAQAVVKANKRLGRVTPRAVEVLASASVGAHVPGDAQRVAS